VDKYWEILVKEIDFAYQPIIDINTKKIYGYEALLRNYKNIGFNTINEFFDTAYLDSTLYKVDLLLREKAIKKFKTFTTNEKLFYNIDNRLLEMPDYSSGNTLNLLNRLNFEKKDFVLKYQKDIIFLIF
jgi:EAL domain-containing protein (putative c-di-GMP-specific phosphodiesterase class I)